MKIAGPIAYPAFGELGFELICALPVLLVACCNPALEEIALFSAEPGFFECEKAEHLIYVIEKGAHLVSELKSEVGQLVHFANQLE